MRERKLSLPIAVALLTIGLACSSSFGGGEPQASTQRRDERGVLIDHVSPSRDSVGPAPTRFEWTPAAGADRYAFGLWTDINVLVWRSDRIQTVSVEIPKEVVLEPGTYFWSVTALRDDRQIGESGLAAFVVRTNLGR
jgi:hypothetical protein